MKKDYEILKEAQDEANSAKNKLISIMYELEEAGFIRESRSLGTIIGKLEAWQNK